MNVGQLRDALDGLDDDVEVRLMHQPKYPFEYAIQDAVLLSDFSPVVQQGAPMDPEDEDEDPEDYFEPADYEDGKEILYLTEGEQLGYGTKDAWR